MSVSFTKKEIEYLKSQRLARIATATKKGEPDIAPVGFDFDGEYFYVGGHMPREQSSTGTFSKTLELP